MSSTLYTYPLEFPGWVVSSADFTAWAVVSVSRSPFTGSKQKQVYPNRGLRASITLGFMTRADMRRLNAFRMKLNACEGSFLFGDPAYAGPYGSGAGAPVVDGASQTGQQLATKGWTASAAGVLLAGDYVQIGSGATSQLLSVMDDVAADATGRATVNVWPQIRSAPTDASPLVLSSPRGVFSLVGTDMPWPERPGQWQPGVTIDIEEDF